MLTLWQMSLSAAVLIALTALLRCLVTDRLPRRMYIALWDLAALALLIPFRLNWNPLSLLERLRFIGQTQAGSTPIRQFVLQEPTPLSQAALQTAQTVQAEADALTGTIRAASEAVQTAPDWLWHAVGLIWLIGAALLAALLLYRRHKCLRAFAEALPCADERVTSFLQKDVLHRNVHVRMSYYIVSPLSYGIVRPVILLPASMVHADDSTLNYVLSHELMHIRAWDALRKAALLIALCIHWPNPCAWLLVHLCNRDMELMCDERVLSRCGGRKAYCTALLDMEARRSELTMGTCFSVTAIEERIKVMKNRKHKGILSNIIAIALVFCALLGAMAQGPFTSARAEDTNAPRTTTNTTNFSPKYYPVVSKKSWEENYAKYAPYGLGYDEAMGLLTYNGGYVRYFEDMWPIGEAGMETGSCYTNGAGTVIVFGVREFPDVIQRNPDGSFDPSGVLKSLREATPEEYEAYERAADDTAIGIQVAEEEPIYVSAKILIPSENQAKYAADMSDVEWWTAEEYEMWIELERVRMQELVDKGERFYTPTQGWVTWTQEKLDETMARHEKMLESIRNGALLSKPSSDGAAVSVIIEPNEILQGSIMQFSTVTEGVLQEATPVDEAHIAVLQDLEKERFLQMYKAIEPYIPFGMSFAYDADTDTIRLYWNGAEVRGVFDAMRGMWITEHAGIGFYPEDAKELIAVYNEGTLLGLREANAEESAYWDNIRKDNTASLAQ